MSKYISRSRVSLVLAALLVAGACSDSKTDDTLAQDTSLARDLQMANQDTMSQPALQDVPAMETPTVADAAPAPARSTPSRPRTTVRTPPRTTTPARPAPSAPTRTESGNTVTPGTKGSERAFGSIPAGSEISLASNL